MLKGKKRFDRTADDFFRKTYEGYYVYEPGKLQLFVVSLLGFSIAMKNAVCRNP